MKAFLPYAHHAYKFIKKLTVTAAVTFTDLQVVIFGSFHNNLLIIWISLSKIYMVHPVYSYLGSTINPN